MKSKYLVPIALILTTGCLTACGNNVEEPTTISIVRFNTDNQTVRQEDESPLLSSIEQEINNEETQENPNYGYNKNEYIGELIIENRNDTDTSEETQENSEETDTESDGTNEKNNETATENNDTVTEEDNVDEVDTSINSDVSYTIIGNDVHYNDKVFTDLSIILDDVVGESLYDKDTLIKFILNTYKVDDNSIFVSGGTYDDSSDEIQTIHEELSESSENYRRLSSKYNDEVSWNIELYTFGHKHTSVIAGCKSFVVVMGTDDTISVDITNFE